MKWQYLTVVLMLAATTRWAFGADRQSVDNPQLRPPAEVRQKPPTAPEDSPEVPIVDDSAEPKQSGDPGEDRSVLIPQNGTRESDAQLRPADLLGEVLTPVSEEPLSGQELPLADVLRRAGNERARQIKAVFAYWRLAAAQAEFYAAVRSYARFKDSVADQQHTAEIRAGRAQLRAVFLLNKQRVVDAQADLMTLLEMAADAKWPLAADRPHVGRYETFYQEKQSGTAPRRLALLDRRIGTEHQLIEDRCAAVDAERDVLAEVSRAFAEGKAEPREWLAACDSLFHQERAYVDAVRDYNSDIAEYALTVAPPSTPLETLVGMLITVKKPAAIDEPPGRGAFFPGRSPISPLRNTSPSASGPGSLLLAARVEVSPLFQGLVELRPKEQAQKLGHLLYEPGAVADSQAVSLRECLERVARGDWGRVIATYWEASAAAAEQEALRGVAEQLAQLDGTAVAARTRPGGTRAALYLAAAKRGTAADLTEQKVACTTARFDLTALVGSPLSQAWLIPESPPHTGGFHIQDPGRTIHLSALVTNINLIQNELSDRATAVVLADQQRVEAINHPRESTALPLRDELATIAEQRHCTLGFIAAAKRYSVTIGQYAVAVAPEKTTPARLAESLLLESVQE